MKELKRVALAELVRTYRRKEGMTQVELAQTAGVGVRFIRELEAEKPTLRMDKVNQVLWLFGYELGPVPSLESSIKDDDGES